MRVLGVVLCAVLCSSAPTRRARLTAAFVGNSYTYYSDLPAMIADIAAAEGNHLTASSNTPGGSALWQHAEEGVYAEETKALLARRSWDFVVLQDQSQTPGGGRVSSGSTLPIGEGKARSIAALGWFAPRIRSSRTVLYSTWGRRDGDANNPELYPTFLQMNKLTTEGYAEYATHLDQPLIVPAGAAFKLVYEDSERVESNNTKGKKPPVTHKDLYWSQADDSHPSLEGTYLVACLFYGTLFDRPVEGLKWAPSRVSAAEAEYLQSVAARALADQRRQGGVKSVNVSNSRL